MLTSLDQKFKNADKIYFGYYNPNCNILTGNVMIPRSRSESSTFSPREITRVSVSFDLISWRKSNIPITTDIREIVNLNRDMPHNHPLFQAFDQLDINIYLSLDLVNWYIITNPIRTVRLTNIFTVGECYYMIDFITNDLFFSKDLEQFSGDVWTKAQFLPSVPYSEGISSDIKILTVNGTPYYYLTTKNCNYHYISTDMRVWKLINIPECKTRFNRLRDHEGFAILLSLDHRMLFYSSDFEHWNDAHVETLNDDSTTMKKVESIKYYAFVGSYCIKCVRCSDEIIKWFVTSDFSIWNELQLDGGPFTFLSFEPVRGEDDELRDAALFHVHGSRVNGNGNVKDDGNDDIKVEGRSKLNIHYLTKDFIHFSRIRECDGTLINSIRTVGDKCIVYSNQSSDVYFSNVNDLKNWHSLTAKVQTLMPDLEIHDCDIHRVENMFIVSVNFLRILFYSEDLEELSHIPLPDLKPESYYTMKRTDMNVYAIHTKDDKSKSVFISKNLRDWSLVEVVDDQTHDIIQYRKVVFCKEFIVAYDIDDVNIYYSRDIKTWFRVDINLYDTKHFSTIRFDEYGKHFVISSLDNKTHFISRDMKIWKYMDLKDEFQEVEVLSTSSNDYVF